MKKTLCLVLLSSCLFGSSEADCYDFLEKGDENLRNVQTEKYLDYKWFYSNFALTYYKRYEICMKYESESESENYKAPKSKESIKK